MTLRNDLTVARDALNTVLAQSLPDDPAPSDGTTIRVKTGDALQAAVDSAGPDTTILVQPASYGPLTLRAKPNVTRDHPITIKADTAMLPPAGTRVDPSYADALVKIAAGSGGGSALVTEPGASGYRLSGVQLLPGRVDVAVATLGSDVVTDPLQQPSDLVLDRCLILADATKGGRRGVAANTRSLTVTGCHIAGFWYTDDAQAILGWNGPGPFLIENSYLEGSGQCVMFGGSDSKAVALMPQNLTLRGCTLSRPMAWRGMAGATIKTVLELKAMMHAVITGNIIENCWVNGQAGYLVQLTPRNQSGGAPWSTVEDILIAGNVLRNGASGFNFLGTDNLHPSGRLTNVRVLNNFMYNIDPVGFGNDKTIGRLLQFVAGPSGVELGGNTMLGAGTAALGEALYFDGAAGDGFNVHDNVMDSGKYGLMGTGASVGAPTWVKFTGANSTFLNNLMVRRVASGLSATAYPGTGTVVSGQDEVVVAGRPPVVIPKYARPGLGADLSDLLSAIGIGF